MLRLLKKLLPKTLFGRTLLILLVPIIIIQAIAAYQFYFKHWSSVQRHLAGSLAGEISMISNTIFNAKSGKSLNQFTSAIRHDLNLQVKHWVQTQPLNTPTPPDYMEFFINSLNNKIHYTHSVRHNPDGDIVDIFVSSTPRNSTKKHYQHKIIKITAPEKRLLNSTTYIFIFWLVGSALALILVAILFLKNQIRPISRLAKSTADFGIGKSTQEFKPEGAKEVRQAGQAFIKMRNRINRQIMQRNQMLAGISHDLRTPLTRMKLQLTMLPKNLRDKLDIKDMKGDINEMHHMIDAYLDYLRGEEEETQLVNLNEMLETTVNQYKKTKPDMIIDYSYKGVHNINSKPNAIKRVINNILDNACKYGSKIYVNLQPNNKSTQLIIEDNGKGISTEEQGKVLDPFYMVDSSRNSVTGGKGLGLAIVKEILDEHKAKIKLSSSEHLGGLKVVIEF